MRSSMLLTSALAIGTLAGPVDRRWIATKVELTIKTVTVYVTAGYETAHAVATSSPHRKQPINRHSKLSSSSSSYAAPSVAPPMASEKAAEPAPQPKTSDAYVPPPPPPSPSVETSTATPEPAPTPTPEYTPAPAPEPQPSAPPASGEHKSGEIQATFSAGPDYQAAIIYHHNAARANHGAGPLVWDDKCVEWAQKTADTCIFDHPKAVKDGGPGNGDQGQNLATNSGDSFNVTSAITEGWYKGEMAAMAPYWGLENIPEEAFKGIGHLTQVLWKSTTKVGCVSINCGTKMKVGGKVSDMNKFTVCNYAAAGNAGGEYAKQVSKPISTTNLGSWSD
ncbi:CAP domain-containing protein [Massariosphaeria phaeospora]|uniref:CAP domain-containing protein n=1 Tax=Massariosphaeria phaeospora TaxID=100035 RepID=A0A7C8I1K4_9PLEO|nr:CAP domain-containing protein [Massariosphaeria phaeospora]